MPPIGWDLNERVERVPIGAGLFGTGLFGTELETTVYRPPGEGPFPLVVINHGKTTGNNRLDVRVRYVPAAREFLRMGYAVAIPMRPGFARSTGAYIDYGCDIEGGGRHQAEAVEKFVAAFSRRHYVDPGHVFLVGESQGGLAVMALASRTIPGVKGVANFAGGLRYETSGMDYCDWRTALVEAFSAYGADAQIPSLWFYGDNDVFWGRDLPRAMLRAYREGAGAAGAGLADKAEWVAYGAYAGGDAHSLFSEWDGVPVWIGPLRGFMRRVGLPTELKYDILSHPRPAPTGFAAVTEVDKVPYLPSFKRAAYEKYLAAARPRAFAVADNGYYGWASGGADPLAAAVINCGRAAQKTCTLYSVDDAVVWTGGPGE